MEHIENQHPYCSYYKKGSKEGCVLRVKVQPRSSRKGPLGVFGEQLKWGVNSAPTDGEANRELIQSVAKHFGIARSLVEILSGETSRNKVILLENVAVDEVKRAL